MENHFPDDSENATNIHKTEDKQTKKQKKANQFPRA